MHLRYLFEGGVILAAAGGAAAYRPAPTVHTDVIAAAALTKLIEYYATSPNKTAGCTLQNAAVRREWSVLPTLLLLSSLRCFDPRLTWKGRRG